MHNPTNDNQQLQRQMSAQSQGSGGGSGGGGGASGANCENSHCNRCDRKHLRDTLYTEIFQRHRRSIFAFASFLRMLKSRKANYNVIKQDPQDLD